MKINNQEIQELIFFKSLTLNNRLDQLILNQQEPYPPPQYTVNQIYSSQYATALHTIKQQGLIHPQNQNKQSTQDNSNNASLRNTNKRRAKYPTHHPLTKYPLPLAFAYFQSYEKEKLHDKAMNVLKNHLQRKNTINPHIINYNISCLYRQMNDSKKAIFYLESVLKEKPFFQYAVIDYSFLLSMNNRSNEALQILKRHLVNSSSNSYSKYPLSQKSSIQSMFLNLAYQTKGVSQKDILKIFSNKSLEIQAFFNLGLYLKKTKSYLKAEEIFCLLIQRMDEYYIGQKSYNSSFGFVQKEQRVYFNSKINLSQVYDLLSQEHGQDKQNVQQHSRQSRAYKYKSCKILQSLISEQSQGVNKYYNYYVKWVDIIRERINRLNEEICSQTNNYFFQYNQTQLTNKSIKNINLSSSKRQLNLTQLKNINLLKNKQNSQQGNNYQVINQQSSSLLSSVSFNRLNKQNNKNIQKDSKKVQNSPKSQSQRHELQLMKEFNKKFQQRRLQNEKKLKFLLLKDKQLDNFFNTLPKINLDKLQTDNTFINQDNSYSLMNNTTNNNYQNSTHYYNQHKSNFHSDNSNIMVNKSKIMNNSNKYPQNITLIKKLRKQLQQQNVLSKLQQQFENKKLKYEQQFQGYNLDEALQKIMNKLFNNQKQLSKQKQKQFNKLQNTKLKQSNIKLKQSRSVQNNNLLKQSYLKSSQIKNNHHNNTLKYKLNNNLYKQNNNQINTNNQSNTNNNETNINNRPNNKLQTINLQNQQNTKFIRSKQKQLTIDQNLFKPLFTERQNSNNYKFTQRLKQIKKPTKQQNIKLNNVNSYQRTNYIKNKTYLNKNQFHINKSNNLNQRKYKNSNKNNLSQRKQINCNKSNQNEQKRDYIIRNNLSQRKPIRQVSTSGNFRIKQSLNKQQQNRQQQLRKSEGNKQKQLKIINNKTNQKSIINNNQNNNQTKQNQQNNRNNNSIKNNQKQIIKQNQLSTKSKSSTIKSKQTTNKSHQQKINYKSINNQISRINNPQPNIISQLNKQQQIIQRQPTKLTTLKFNDQVKSITFEIKQLLGPQTQFTSQSIKTTNIFVQKDKNNIEDIFQSFNPKSTHNILINKNAPTSKDQSKRTSMQFSSNKLGFDDQYGQLKHLIPHQFSLKYDQAAQLEIQGKFLQAFDIYTELYKQFKDDNLKQMTLLGIAYNFQLQKQFQQAQKTYLKCSKFNNAQAFMKLGQLLIRRNKIDEGIQNLQKANCIKRFDMEIQTKLVYGYSLKEQAIEKALSLAHSILKRQPLSLQILIMTAKILQKQQKIKQALQICLAIDSHKQSQFIKHYIGTLYLTEGNVVEAFKYFKSALQIKSNHVPSLIQIGTILSELKPKEAISILNKALQIQPDNRLALTRLAKIFESIQENPEKAMEIYRKTLQTKSNYEAYMKIGNCLQVNGSYLEALVNYRQALNLKKTHNVYMKIAQMHEFKKEYKKSIENYQLALDIIPKQHRFYEQKKQIMISMAKDMLILQQFDGVISTLQTLLQSQQSKEIYSMLGQGYFGKQQYSIALEFYQKANNIESQKNDIQILERLALCFDKKQEFNASKKIYEKILEIDPHNIKCINNYANILLIIGNTNEAFYWYEVMLQYCPKNIEKRMKVADIYSAVGDWSKVQYHLLLCYKQKQHDVKVLQKLINLYKQKREPKLVAKFQKKLTMLKVHKKKEH